MNKINTGRSPKQILCYNQGNKDQSDSQ